MHDLRSHRADAGRIVRKDRQVGFALYVLTMSVVVGIVGGLLFFLSDGPEYLTAEQLRKFVATQPEECRPIARARLRRRLVQETVPLRTADVRSVLREIDANDCVAATMQLRELEGPDDRTAG